MELAELIVTVVVAALGWVAVHAFNSRRDARAKHLEVRLKILADAYTTFVRVGIDGTIIGRGADGQLRDRASEVEAAIAMVHLYGTAKQSKAASEYAAECAASGKGSLQPLVELLRGDLRALLKLEQLEEAPTFLRIERTTAPPKLS